MSVYKVGSAVGGVGTVLGIGGTVVMANREIEPTTEQALKTLSKEGEQIKEEQIEKELIKNWTTTDKTKETIETMDKSKLGELVKLEGFKEVDGKNNLCELVQREFVRRMIKEGFNFVGYNDKSRNFLNLVGVCITPTKNPVLSQ